MRPPMPSVILSRRAKIALGVVASIIVALIVLVQLSGVYINYLWFGEVGHRQVYSVVLWTKVILFLVFGLLMAAIIGGNLIAAYVVRPPFRPMSPEQQNLQNYVMMVEPRRKLVLAAVMIIAFLAAGGSAQGKWDTWQLWLHGQSFGIKDPQFGKDISFYAFDYPVYRVLLSFGFSAVIFSLILVVGVHYLTGAIRLQTQGPKITIAARRQLTILVFAFMALKAVAYWLDRYGFVFSSRSKFTGASYTDVHSALPAKTILFWITVILALGVLASMWLRSALLPGIGFIVLMVLSILIGGIYPAIVQSVSVKPNASEKEQPYIKRNINATRQAYDIVTRSKDNPNGSVVYKSFRATTSPAPTEIGDKTNTTIDNIRILDPNVISSTFLNFQKIGLPYGFSSKLNVDRYKIDGTMHDYIVGVREQVPGSNLSGSQDNWINQHTVYTHGYGFVAAQANSDVTNKAPFTEGSIPPVGPLGLSVPQVYYGQLMNDYSVVGGKNVQPEFDANGVTTRYKGKGGVPVSGLLTRLAFAMHYKETSFLLNNSVSTQGAKIIFVRDPKARVQKVAPFLTIDGDPYPIVDQATGHIVWMVDGYTTMADYPYSERQSLSQLTGTSLRRGQRDTQINYIRNSVKATVDAYDGTVNLYQWDSKDPLLKSWMRVFPGLIKPKSAMPADIKQHVRYPQDLFNVQRGLLAQYHISDPVASYNGRGKWAVTPDPFAVGLQPPYYVLARAPGSSSNTPQFQLTTPMVVGGSTNLASYISADCDPAHYGQLTVLTVPGKSTFFGPSQVANDLKSTGIIAKDITQLDQGQSAVIHGNLLTLPVGDSFLYVEPLYVASTGANASYPTLQRVLVRYGDSIGYGETLAFALQDIVQGTTGANIQAGQTTAPTGTPSSPTPSSPAASTPGTGSTATTPPAITTVVPGSQVALLSGIDKYFGEMQADYAKGDYAAAGVALGKAQALVKQYLTTYGKLPSGRSTSGPSPTASPNASPSASPTH